MSKIRPLIFGEVLFDRFPDGQAVLGGAPFNVAWNLRAFQAAPLFISKVGADALGTQVREAMRLWGLDESGLQTDGCHPTGVVDVTLEHGEPHYRIVPDSAWDFIQCENLPDKQQYGLIYHGSLALRQPISHKAWHHLILECDAPRFVDLNLRMPWWRLENLGPMLDGTRWLKLNADELAALAPHTPNMDRRIQAVYDASPGIAWLIVTQGEAGAFAVSAQGERCEVKPVRVAQVMDTVGAGDAFSSVLILGLLRGWPMALSLQRAQEFAAAVVGLRGATTIARDFYQPFINEWHY
jgi:fructokinase